MYNYLEILEITHQPGRKLPLTVEFRAGVERHKLEAKAAHIQTFAAFQPFVFDSLGVWVRHEAEVGDKAAREDWTHAVTTAVSRGKKKAAE